MKLEILSGVSDDFIPLDFMAEGVDDMELCRKIVKFFMLGDLHMRTAGSCLFIEYDGENCSFPIKNEQEEIIKKCLDGIWKGRCRLLVSPSFDGCKFRFIRFKKVKEDENFFQKKLVESYMPPPIIETMESVGKRIGKVKKVYIQERLADSQPVCWNHPLFKNENIKTRQKVLEV